MTVDERDNRVISENIRIDAAEASCGIFGIVKLILIFLFGIYLSGILSPYMLDGMKRAIYNVIPAAFPFMIATDLYLAYGNPEKIPIIGYLFSKITALPKGAVGAYLCGGIAGFPIGACEAGRLYDEGSIDRREAEYLAAVSNNPSLPFTLVVVGEAFLGSRDVGFTLILITYISSILSALIWREGKRKVSKTPDSKERNFSFVTSVKRSAEASLYIAAFVGIFSAVPGILTYFVKNEIILSILSAVTELATATDYISNLDIYYNFKLALIAGALSFGGVSVMMQSSAVASGKMIGKRYFLIKLTQGIIAFIITPIFI